MKLSAAVDSGEKQTSLTRTESSLTFARVGAGAAAWPTAIGWLGIVAQPDSFLEALSAGATTRSPFLPVWVASVDCSRETEDGRLESRLFIKNKKIEKIEEKMKQRMTQNVHSSRTGKIWFDFQNLYFSWLVWLRLLSKYLYLLFYWNVVHRTHPEPWSWSSSQPSQPHFQPHTGTPLHPLPVDPTGLGERFDLICAPINYFPLTGSRPSGHTFAVDHTV